MASGKDVGKGGGKGDDNVKDVGKGGASPDAVANLFRTLGSQLDGWLVISFIAPVRGNCASPAGAAGIDFRALRQMNKDKDKDKQDSGAAASRPGSTARAPKPAGGATPPTSYAPNRPPEKA